VQLSSVSSDKAARGNGRRGGCSIICTVSSQWKGAPLTSVACPVRAGGAFAEQLPVRLLFPSTQSPVGPWAVVLCAGDETFTLAHKTTETLPKPLQRVSTPFTN
jgi:hypothetical protein